MEKQQFSTSELKALNSNRGLMLMLNQGDAINPERALRYINYEKEMARVQGKLVNMQSWVIENKKRVCIIFEGRDAAGKGGAIRRLTHHLNPRHYSVEALPKPTEEEKGQWYFQRYIRRLPNEGEIVLFDRSWYNRAVIEPVNGFCDKDQYDRFMNDVNQFEEMLIKDGIIVIKLYFSITKDEQKKRFDDIMTNPLKRWKMTPVDLKAQELWDTYTEYKEAMFLKTNTTECPWTVIAANRKTKARLQAMQHVLDRVPYNLDKKEV